MSVKKYADANGLSEFWNNIKTFMTRHIYKTCPIGKIDMFAGSVAPNGWLLCDGSAISRSVYSGLFEVIGITYGDGDGETTFNLPDMRGRMPIGSDSTYELGNSGGSSSISYTPGGSIGNTKLSDAQMAHGHGFTQPTVNGGATTTESSKATHRHAIIQASQSGSYTLDYWHWELVNGGTEVFNKQTCSKKGASGTVNADASHSHTQNAHTHSVSGGAVSNLSGASSTRTAHGHSWTGTQSTLNTMSPYRAVNFIIYSGV